MIGDVSSIIYQGLPLVLMKVCVVLLAYRYGVYILGTDCWHSSPILMELRACSSMMKWLYLAHMTRRSNYGTSQLV